LRPAAAAQDSNVARSKPLIGIPADRRVIGPHPYHCVGEKYIDAVAKASLCTPVLIPASAEQIDIESLIEFLDGVLLTGSYSNVEPHRYAGPPSEPGTLHDWHRDETTLPLIPELVSNDIPLFAICRGFQEVNVAFGGTLLQKVHEVPGLHDHRENKDDPLEFQYAAAHEIELVPGGLLRELAGCDRVRVNSVHEQGVQTLGHGLEVEAHAPDGLVEAFRVPSAAFALAVQWHPEWQVMDNPFSRALFQAFGEAAHTRARGRQS
jgi:putative glutamine amidotransferase